MNIDEFAIGLTGREYGREISKEEERLAKELGFVVVFGYSDDNAEFRGAIDDEVGCYNGGNIYLDRNGILEKCECQCKYSKLAKEKARVIKAIWGESWEYETSIPHAEFEIYDDDEICCKGIVFDIRELEG
jgi:hypothetical protein